MPCHMWRAEQTDGWLGRLAAQCPLDQLDAPDGSGQTPPFGLVGGQDGVDRVRRDRLGELCPRGPVSLPGALDAAGEDVPAIAARAAGWRRTLVSPRSSGTQSSIQPTSLMIE